MMQTSMLHGSRESNKQSTLKADIMLNNLNVVNLVVKLIYPLNNSLKSTDLYKLCVFCNMGTEIMFIYMTVFM